MVTIVQTRLGEFSISECENGVHISLPHTRLEDKDITIEMPQCNVPGVVSNYELSVKHFSEAERAEAVRHTPWAELTCEDCGVKSADVELTICPFEQDVHNNEVEVVLCPACYNVRLMEV